MNCKLDMRPNTTFYGSGNVSIHYFSMPWIGVVVRKANTY